MKFTDGSQTQQFESDYFDNVHRLETFEIEEPQSIKYISVRKYGDHFYGLRFYTHDMKIVLNSESSSSDGSWSDPLEMPAERQIIGLSINTLTPRYEDLIDL